MNNKKKGFIEFHSNHLVPKNLFFNYVYFRQENLGSESLSNLPEVMKTVDNLTLGLTAIFHNGQEVSTARYSNIGCKAV